ncbi:MAG: hypothetical protein IPK16_31365 [Anaerolineales bacterium]|nr:hypothetical protein [Anaerolineales bacterium]
MTTSAKHRTLLAVAVIPLLTVLLRTAWINDDAYITFRSVENFVLGHGPVWNVGERVQSFTHPLWMLLLAAGRLITGELYYTPLLLSIALAVAAVLLIALGVAESSTGAILAILIFTGAKAFVDFSTSGLENPLTYVLLAGFLVVLFHPRPGLRWLFWLALGAGLLTLNRMDALLLVLPALLVAWWPKRSWRSALVVGAGFLPFLLWEAFSLFYYGFLFPNTAYAKLNAGVPVALLAQQGLFYLLRSVDLDPLTTAAILAGLVTSLVVRERRSLALALGIILSLAYVVFVGGDFMAGRFMTGPLVLAVAILIRVPLPSLREAPAYLIFAVVIGLSLLNPATSPLLSSFNYRTTTNPNQIEDVRGYHYERTGLLTATAFNRLYDQGVIKGMGDVDGWVACEGMGSKEYYAGFQTYIVDRCALTDALLARLPAIYTPDLYVGHYYRKLPDGYLTTIRTGENHIADPKLAEYYDHLRTVISGPLLAPGRLAEIWRFTTGQYQHLIDRDAYQFPDRKVYAIEEIDRAAHAQRISGDGNVTPSFGANSARIQLETLAHAPYIDLGLDREFVDVIFRHGAEVVGQALISGQYTPLGNDQYHIVAVPEQARTQGYDAIDLIPRAPGDHKLSYVELIAPAHWQTPIDNPAQLLQAVHLYFYTIFRGSAAQQRDLLPALRTQIAGATDAAWVGVPLDVQVDLLKPRDPEMQATVRSHLPAQTTLTDAQGAPRVRYLGWESRPLTPGDPGGIAGDLYFEVLAPLPYASLWFHIVDKTTDAQWMVYDYFPEASTNNWQEATVVRVPVMLEMDPGTYDIAFGFWTPVDRERLYVDRANDVYWLSLGEQRAEE